MTDYIPNLKGRSVVMISDYVDVGYDAEDQEEEKGFLQKIKSDLGKYAIPFYFVEVKNLQELETELSKFNKEKTVVFNWCEELDQKTNTGYLVSEFLEKDGYVYTGANAICLQVSTDRKKTYERLVQNGVNVPKQYSLNGNYTGIDFPVIAKALYVHGSFDISEQSVLENESDVRNFEEKINKADFELEQFIPGREFTVPIWGNNKPAALPVMEIVFKSNEKEKYKVQSYGSKWDKNDPDYLGIYVDQSKGVSDVILKSVSDECCKAFVALGCSGLARMEVRLDEHTNMPYVIDVNPNPNYRPGTSIFKSAAALGLNEGQVTAKLCELAIEKFC
jgi:D-alanine-D-alanine ligase